MKAILSWLLYHANKKGDFYFYQIKNKLLKKYGEFICYDVQFIEGKKCYSCEGTGLYSKYEHGIGWIKETCWNCTKGWYKRPVWNILARMKFGKYEFHQPYQRAYEKPDNSIQIIEGYFDHKRTSYTEFALFVLHLIYEKGYLKRYYKELYGWRLYWWLPRNYLHNIVHLIKFRTQSYPIRNFIDAVKLMNQRGKFKKFETSDELPF